MPRSTTFRVLLDGEWNYATLDEICKHLGFEYGIPSNVIAFADPEARHKTEFTGLKDKNEKKIWEGDIVMTEYGKATVNKAAGYYSIRYINEDDFGFLSAWSSENNRKEIEVIGNVHENPELIK